MDYVWNIPDHPAGHGTWTVTAIPNPPPGGWLPPDGSWSEMKGAVTNVIVVRVAGKGTGKGREQLVSSGTLRLLYTIVNKGDTTAQGQVFISAVFREPFIG